MGGLSWTKSFSTARDILKSTTSPAIRGMPRRAAISWNGLTGMGWICSIAREPMGSRRVGLSTLLLLDTTFQELLVQLLLHPEHSCWMPVGRRIAPKEREWFARGVLAPTGEVHTDTPYFRVTLCTQPPFLPPEGGREPRNLEGCLWLGDGPSRTKHWGIVLGSGTVEPLHRLILVGAGMFTLAVAAPNVR